ncbi:MAG: tRNA (adenosine(37)-N6)-dimethylallyltransferase MiaA [Candidatus Taylorbacteria bacterium RIFCSPHIGHO2_01_FULL_46_22b]|uniref:tRNA dimethylallyltransferase n=1 Tax=Candidatus Taylorbacteria bacterium RIFCSPHIGHO2_01_FULL_46_22b TaxID=1802301 RepID=A0A1G2M1L7_9BACT|nr:MAG: tRNA (adenosine(37)-N6)-dimethylallyltransferase MiaA [Candidatus Taylorbacteria bacterium RIFCSPHIGHO2_01_FULL_46_22b]
MKPKLIVVLGPTAVGKSALAIQLARRFNGEIISADSRQVYTGLNIGTGKVTKKEMCGVRHHLLDVENPKHRYSVVHYVEQAKKAINEIQSQGKLPIICGGTGFYISALVDGIILPEVPPNKKLRSRLAKKSSAELMIILKKLDLKRAKGIDPRNNRRMIRAIEIATTLGKVPAVSKTLNYNPFFIGITLSSNELKQRIQKRLLDRMKQGMIVETKKLHKQGLSWKRMNELGLEYRYLALHLRGKLTRAEMIEKLNHEIWQYARRQMTWFRPDKRINWFSPAEGKKIENSIKKFL